MAFWGIELQPGKPYTHFFDKAQGKLHISKATLGVTSAELISRTIVQCKIGNNTPIFLCSFRQFKKESCSVDIDFGEDVVFEVIGTSSVHLAGSYLGNGHSTEDKPSGTGLVVEFLALGKDRNAKAATPGSLVTVHYTGKLRNNGSQYISTIGSDPFTFRLRVPDIIKGWELGLIGMRIGDKRRLTVPPSMGYDSRGRDGVPPEAWLVFEVEIVSIAE